MRKHWKYPRPPLKEVREHLHYDPDTGLLSWKRSGKGRNLTKPTGYLGVHGYMFVRFNSRKYPVHIIAFAIMRGRWPNRELDHKNTIRSDNRWSNLRLASRCQNRFNLPKYKTNTSGFKGVVFQDKRWRAEISAKGKRYYLGMFPTKKQAAAAYANAATKLHKEFARF